MKRLLVISPHLDDAVYGCGDLLAARPGSTVVTIFAGIPTRSRSLTEWDAICGFLSGQEAVMSRRREDETALAQLAARPVWLDFCDAQYGETPSCVEVTRALRRVLRRTACDTVCLPLGLYHSDHELAHHATLALIRESPAHEWLCYEDALYRRIPDAVRNRMERLARSHRVLPPRLNSAGLTSAKRRAVYCYESQLRGLSSAGRPGHLDALTAERYWPLGVEEQALHG